MMHKIVSELIVRTYACQLGYLKNKRPKNL